MKRKRKMTSASSAATSVLSALSPEPASYQPAENGVKEDDSPVHQEGKLDETGDHQPVQCAGPTDGQLNPEASCSLLLTAVLSACHQGDLETPTTDITEEVSDGIAGNLCPVPIETAESNVRCPNETDMPAASVTENIDISRLVNADQPSDTSDCPIMEERHTGGDASEMPPNVSPLPGDGCQEPNFDLEEASQKYQPLNETLYLPHTPSILEFTSQSDLQDPQTIAEGPRLSDCDPKLPGGDEEHYQDPESQPRVVMSPEETWLTMTDQTIPFPQADPLAEDLRVLTNGLDLQDSQLLGAFRESLNEPGKSAENLIRDHLTSSSPGQEIPQAAASPPSVPVQDIRGLQQRRTEDATSTVQGLIMELSNINRLIMSTYRELRQKRVRHTAGRGAVSRRRRREM
ncbi:break repair meiotic recombinase recruitment factor 1 isoform X1 [Bufo bufo]|uniref:break repair meiotic recombinase recruitment factor 1 isoform X1 n=1 Tax=Bufo bufo TaxID=8384 RepID=UPI001ABDB9D1|nr:break repair meiotic recombinase recruitment factor 1 isoform X1 [Bufo bufo]